MSEQQPTRQLRIPLPLFLLLMIGAIVGALLAAFAYTNQWPPIYLILGIIIWLTPSITLLLLQKMKRTRNS